MKKYLLYLFSVICTITVSAQLKEGTFTTDEEGLTLLKNLSESNLRNGDIMLFTTTHQDLGWLNHVDACVIDRDTLWLTPFIDRLGKDPDFKMDIEQTSIIMEYIHRHPDKKDIINKYLKEGRICVGATYIQPYEEMYSGEALARQFYLGSRYMKKNFDGYTPLSYFNVDVPGRTMQMPQIMTKAGVENLIISRHERGLFYWKAPDGSKVRTYSPGHYIYFYNVLGMSDTAAVKELGREAVLWYEKFNDVKGAKGVMPAMLNYEFIWDQKPVQNCIPFITMWNSIKEIKTENGKPVKVNLPKFKYAIADDFFKALNSSTSNLDSIQGERPNVWLYIHGPSHEKAITASRKGDILLPMAEKISVLNYFQNGNFNRYPTQRINRAWEAKIYPDHGWGGKNGVQTDNRFLEKYNFALAESEAMVQEGVSELASNVMTDEQKGIPIVVFNSLSWKQDGIVETDINFEEGYTSDIQLTSSDGKPVAIQLSDVSYYDDNSIKSAKLHFIATNLPSIGIDTYYINPSSRNTNEISRSNKNIIPRKIASGEIIETNFYSIQLGEGGIRQIRDKELGLDLLDNEKFMGGEVITMQSVGNGAGEFDAVQQPTMEGFDKTGNYSPQWELIEDGDVFTLLKYRTPIKHAVIEQYLKIYKGIKKIDFDIAILNWEEILYREFRMMLPLSLSDAEVSYEVPFGILTVGKDEMEGAAGERYYVPNKELHPRGIGNWISAANSSAAVTLSSSVAVADYIDPTSSDNNKTILQPILMASRMSCHGEGNPYLQPGDHYFHFSMTSGRPDKIAQHHFGVSSNEKPETVVAPQQYKAASLNENTEFIGIDNSNVIISALKKCEDDNTVIIRLYSLSPEEQTVNLTGIKTPKEIIHVNLIEEEIGEVPDIKIGAYGIETYKLKF